MANAWLRLWHDMPNDPKWRTIARVSGQPIATVMAVYIHLLVSASRNVTHMSRQVTTDKDTDTELNPTHNARMRESAPTGESHGAPLQTAEPEYLDGL
ncbi:hypothetical protein HEK80_025665, partial [Escherichia coli]|nr:hypothetical protein [Escherichia coli]